MGKYLEKKAKTKENEWKHLWEIGDLTPHLN